MHVNYTNYSEINFLTGNTTNPLHEEVNSSQAITNGQGSGNLGHTDHHIMASSTTENYDSYEYSIAEGKKNSTQCRPYALTDNKTQCPTHQALAQRCRTTSTMIYRFR